MSSHTVFKKFPLIKIRKLFSKIYPRGLYFQGTQQADHHKTSNKTPSCRQPRRASITELTLRIAALAVQILSLGQIYFVKVT
jgi:hypothetical protein